MRVGEKHQERFHAEKQFRLAYNTAVAYFITEQINM